MKQAETNFRQYRKVGVAGGLFNQLMGNNATLPEVGKGATILLYSDRHAYEVMSVSDDKRTAVIQRYNAKLNPNKDGWNPHNSEFTDYSYEELSGCNETITFRNGAWRRVINRVVFINPDTVDRANPELWDEHFNLKLVEDITRISKKFDKVSIIWGRKDEYYDPTF